MHPGNPLCFRDLLYLYFCNDFRETVKSELQKETGIEPKATTITKELGVRWNKLKADGNIAKY